MYIHFWLTGRNEKMENPIDRFRTLNNDQLIAVYRKMRERRDEAKKIFTESQKPLLDAMQMIENVFLERFEESGETASKTPSGTAYTVTDTSVTVKEWGEFLGFVINNQAWDLLEHRAAKLSVVEYAEEHGDLPPGLSMSRMKKVNIRANTGVRK
jgi:hypothetical protein